MNSIVVNVKVDHLRKDGYRSVSDWKKDLTHLYIGRNMSMYVPGTDESKWANPYSAKTYGLNTCLLMYEEYIKANSDLYNSLHEIDNKVLGCWCKPGRCHGDVLIEMRREQLQNQSNKKSTSKTKS